jgi:hypothetical protein
MKMMTAIPIFIERKSTPKAVPTAARAGNRRFWLLDALSARTKAQYKYNLLPRTRRARGCPWRARTGGSWCRGVHPERRPQPNQRYPKPSPHKREGERHHSQPISVQRGARTQRPRVNADAAEHCPDGRGEGEGGGGASRRFCLLSARRTHTKPA